MLNPCWVHTSIHKTMKTTFCLVTVLASVGLARAQEGDYAPDSEAYSTPVVYTPPVVYQAPVIYQAPVVYYAPVYYLASAAALAGYVSCDRGYTAPSTVIHITGGQGTYSYSNYGDCGSTVIHIGARQNRAPAYYRFNRWR